jgi:hypothetical protein
MEGRAADGMSDHAFISYSRSESEFVTRLAEGLKGRGVRVWLDVWSIQPADDWDLAIERALRECAVFLIILSPSAVASVEVRGELRAAMSNRKRIVPVLHKSCEVPRQLRTIQYIEIGAEGGLTDESIAHLASVISERPDSTEVFSDDRHLQNRRDLLNDVRLEVADRLEPASDAGGALVLLKERQPHQVHRHWDDDVKIPRVDRPLPPSSSSMVDMFDEAFSARKLLILGEPGSGKTTALLELASALAVRAEAGADAPLPAILNLCSWRPDPAGIASWLVDEMKLKYGVRKDITREWLEERMLAPLLDGLDEVAPENQIECVRAVNEFVTDYRPRHIVVCCRLAEYENLGIKLRLGGAIRLLPLGAAQIQDYLQRAQCADLWRMIETDRVSMELARAPLFLRMMVLAYRETSDEAWRTLATLSERREYLVDTYIRHLLSAEDEAEGTARIDSRRWLAWLASGLKKQNQEELLIERIQPGWLPAGLPLWTYRVAVGLTSFLVVRSAIGVLVSLQDRVPRGPVGTRLFSEQGMMPWWARDSGDFLATTVLALIPAVALAMVNHIVPIETLRWSPAKARQQVAYWTGRVALAALDIGALCGGIAGALFGLVDVYDGADSAWSAVTASSQRAGLIAGTLTGLLSALALVGAKPSGWFRGDTHNWRSARGGAAVSIGLVIAAGLWPSGLVPGLWVAAMLMLGRHISDAAAESVARATMVGFVATIGLTWQFTRSFSPPREFFELWLVCGAGVGGLAAAVFGLRAAILRTEASDEAEASRQGSSRSLLGPWARWAAAGIVAAVLAAIACTALIALGRLPIVQNTLLAAITTAQAQGLVLMGSAIFSLALGLSAAVLGAFAGALFGTLKGVTGPDVMRRSVPNQGIRQSARNVPVFALIGMVVIGLPYGIMNTAIGGLATGTIPDTRDWIRMGLGSAAYLGILGGLVPAAACIQHMSLRFVMWLYGLAPFRYGRFLNHATERMLLRRIGGRYRFLHVLLRDRFARMATANAA